MNDPSKMTKVESQVSEDTSAPESEQPLSRRSMLGRCLVTVGGLALAGCSTGSSGSSGTTSSGTSSKTSTTATTSTLSYNTTGSASVNHNTSMTANVTNLAGDFLVMAVSVSATAGVVTNAPQVPFGWTSLASVSDKALATMYLYTYSNATANQNTTVVFAGNTTASVIIVDITPTSGSTASVDAIGTNSSQGTVGTKVSASTSSSTTNANDIVVAFVNTDTNQTPSSYGGLFAQGTPIALAPVVLSVALGTTSTTGVQTLSATITSDNWTGAILAIQ